MEYDPYQELVDDAKQDYMESQTPEDDNYEYMDKEEE